MPPEMFLSKNRGLASDIWSVGVIVYYLATQKLPFDSTEAILNSESSPLPKTFTPKFKNLVESMLKKNLVIRPSAELILVTIFHDFRKLFLVFIQRTSFKRNPEPRSGINDFLQDFATMIS
jgi:serine/threonine protein kinase